MLTGPKRTIYDFALQELKLGLQDSVSVDSNFVHTDYIALLDKDRVIRGYYHGTDTSALKRLSDDLVFIMLEKDKNRRSTAFDELRPLMIPITVILLGTAAGVVFFSRRSKNYQRSNSIIDMNAPLEQRSYNKVIIIVSIAIPAAVAFLILVPQAKIDVGFNTRSLPLFHAILNSSTAILLIASLYFIRHGQVTRASAGELDGGCAEYDLSGFLCDLSCVKPLDAVWRSEP